MKKKKMSFPWGFTGLILLLILVIVVLSYRITQPEYKIYKCHNESESDYQYQLNYKTISYDIVIDDKRTNSEKFVDLFTDLNSDKINLKMYSPICGSYVQNAMPRGSVETTVYSQNTIQDDGSGIPIINSNSKYLLCTTSNFQFKEICVDEICKNVSFDKEDCDNAIRLINGTKRISLDYKKKTCFDIYPKEKQVCNSEVDDMIIQHQNKKYECHYGDVIAIIEVESYKDIDSISNPQCKLYQEEKDLTINKKDLTKDFLDNRCLCKSSTDEKGNYNNPKYVSPYCKVYSCFDNYGVKKI